MNEKDNSLLRVDALKMYFPVTKGPFGVHAGTVKAVDNVSFSIEKGKTFGLVGESGCGKTTTGKCILKINHPTAGKIYYKGNEIAGMSDRQFAPYRREIQLIFQDPTAHWIRAVLCFRFCEKQCAQMERRAASRNWLTGSMSYYIQ